VSSPIVKLTFICTIGYGLDTMHEATVVQTTSLALPANEPIRGEL
jgi:hypothetical protein